MQEERHKVSIVQNPERVGDVEIRLLLFLFTCIFICMIVCILSTRYTHINFPIFIKMASNNDIIYAY